MLPVVRAAIRSIDNRVAHIQWRCAVAVDCKNRCTS